MTPKAALRATSTADPTSMPPIAAYGGLVITVLFFVAFFWTNPVQL